jgi:hypothetical protein
VAALVTFLVYLPVGKACQRQYVEPCDRQIRRTQDKSDKLTSRTGTEECHMRDLSAILQPEKIASG